MFVCWQGHKDNAGLAQSFFESFKTYWGISGSVTKLGSCNLYGCEIPGSGGGYPAPPPSDARRFLIDAYGRKAKVFLVCHKQDYEPIEIELPFEYAAVLEEMRVLGGGSFAFGASFELGKTRKKLSTYGEKVGFDPISLELIHGTLSIDAEFAYINLFYGGERIHEEPMNLPVPIRLAAQGFGSPTTGPSSNYGNDFFIRQRLGLSPQLYGAYYRTEGLDLMLRPQNPEYASFGGLPALMQQTYLDTAGGGSNSGNPSNSEIPLKGFFFKDKQDWTAMDWIHYQLQEMPRQFNPLITILPPGVSIRVNGTNIVNIIYDLDKKFGRQARAETIMPASSFGYNGSYSGGDSPPYISQGGVGPEPLFTSYKEQLTGNGLFENGTLARWYRITPSSFPVFGQLLRNY